MTLDIPHFHPDQNLDLKLDKIDVEALKTQPERYLNRELSWLAFNQRVLDEACNLSHPIFERLRFLSIASSNLDEFYMVRVAGLMAQVRNNVTERSVEGLTPQQQIIAIQKRALIMNEDIQMTWRDLMQELALERHQTAFP